MKGFSVPHSKYTHTYLKALISSTRCSNQIDAPTPRTASKSALKIAKNGLLGSSTRRHFDCSSALKITPYLATFRSSRGREPTLMTAHPDHLVTSELRLDHHHLDHHLDHPSTSTSTTSTTHPGPSKSLQRRQQQRTDNI